MTSTTDLGTNTSITVGTPTTTYKSTTTPTTTYKSTTTPTTTYNSTTTPTTTYNSTTTPTTTYESTTELPESDKFNIDEVDLSETDQKIHYIIDKIKPYSNSLKKVYKNNNDISDSFERMKQLDKDKKIDILWKYLISNYKNNFEYMISNFDKIKKKNMKI